MCVMKNPRSGVGSLPRFKQEEQEHAWKGSVDIECLLRYERRGSVDMLVKQSIIGTIVPWEATEEMLQGNTDIQRMLRCERRGHLLDVLGRSQSLASLCLEQTRTHTHEWIYNVSCAWHN